MREKKISYGGFLPFELDLQHEFFDFNSDQLQRYNSGKTAAFQALLQIEPKRVWLPYYLCPNVCEIVEENCSEVKYYHITNLLLPKEIDISEGDCLFLVNYFGIMDSRIDDYLKFIPDGISVIIDNCHSFYHQPIIKENIYNIYSCKKFFGVPDGAYLIGEKLNHSSFGLSYAADKAGYLLECLESGTDSCYQKKRLVDLKIKQERASMSELTKLMMQTVNYTKVKNKRYHNFKIYEQRFGKKNFINCLEESIPYIYPLCLGKNIKNELIQRRIYVPTLWEHIIDRKFEDNIEYFLAEKTIFLPLDQRYNEKDIIYICEQVESIINKYET